MPKVLKTESVHSLLIEELMKSYRIDRQSRNICRGVWILCFIMILLMGYTVGERGYAEWQDAFALVFYGLGAWITSMLDKFYGRCMTRRL